MFDPDFYPTPPEVAALMLDPLDLRGKVALEPSAGKGDLVRECLARGAAEVLWCEKEPQLRSIIMTSIAGAIPAGHNYDDFLNVPSVDVSHIDMIVMNPPFSADERHILHAWEIAPPGCEIVALCNWNTIEGRSWGRQRELAHLIEAYGASENLGECFSIAERPTRVSVGMVRLTKPGTRASGDEFKGFFRFKAHLKGTVHFEFLDDEVWAAVNARYARIKGQVLPETHRRPKRQRRGVA